MISLHIRFQWYPFPFSHNGSANDLILCRKWCFSELSACDVVGGNKVEDSFKLGCRYDVILLELCEKFY